MLTFVKQNYVYMMIKDINVTWISKVFLKTFFIMLLLVYHDQRHTDSIDNY